MQLQHTNQLCFLEPANACDAVAFGQALEGGRSLLQEAVFSQQRQRRAVHRIGGIPILTPYGFRNRNDNVRHGYCLGTAVLSPPRLQELHNVVRQAAGRLADPSAQDLLAELDERLGWAGISADGLLPVRSFARHAVVDTALVRRDSLAAPRRAEAIEAAIIEHRRVLLQRYPGVGSFADSPDGELRVWPLQLIFHNVGWYLLFEEDQVGREQGLIRSERLIASPCYGP